MLVHGQPKVIRKMPQCPGKEPTHPFSALIIQHITASLAALTYFSSEKTMFRTLSYHTTSNIINASYKPYELFKKTIFIKTM